jgi:hypothetical protein
MRYRLGWHKKGLSKNPLLLQRKGFFTRTLNAHPRFSRALVVLLQFPCLQPSSRRSSSMSRLIAAWIGFDVLLFASGVVLITLSRLWTTEDILLNLVFPPLYLNGSCCRSIWL